MKFYVDRIAEAIAVLEDDNGEISKINLTELPSGTKEGSVLLFENGIYTLDNENEAERKDELFSLQNFLFGEDE